MRELGCVLLWCLSTVVKETVVTLTKEYKKEGPLDCTGKDTVV